MTRVVRVPFRLVWVVGRIVAAAVAGTALAVAFEPFALWPLLPVAIAAFALLTRDVGAWSGAAIGFAFGAGFYYVHTEWLWPSVGVGPWIGMNLILTLSVTVFGAVAPALHRLPAWPVAWAVVWTAFEAQRGVFPWSGMPWGRLSFASIDTPAASAVGWYGLTGLSLGLAFFSASLAWLTLEVRRWLGERSDGGRPPAVVARVGVAVGLLALVLPGYAPAQPEQTGTARVAVVQGNVPGAGNDVLFDSVQLTQNHVDATLELAAAVADGSEPQPELVVWPENSTTMDPFGRSQLDEEIQRAVTTIGVPVMVGSVVDGDPGEVLNQGIVWDPVTGPGERFNKNHPVAFGEYIPYRRYTEDLFPSFDRIPRDMRAGATRPPMEPGGIPVANMICFDIAYQRVLYDQVGAGARLVTVQTSNATFAFTKQIDQQFAMTRLRAIEAGRWLTLASTNGLSGIIAPDGTVVETADRQTQAVMTAEVGLVDGLTPAVRMGQWPVRVIWLATALLFGWLAVQAIRGGRRRHGTVTP